MTYHEIRNSHDIASFIAVTNGLHDGYLVSAYYEHTGFEWGNPLYADEQKSVLKLQIMVTSMLNTRIELVFEAVHAWQIKKKYWIHPFLSKMMDGFSGAVMILLRRTPCGTPIM